MQPPLPQPQVPSANLLLSGLPNEDKKRFMAACEPVELIFSETLTMPGQRISHVYFPTESLISLIEPIDGNPGLEVGLIGNEGMLGISLVLGIDVAPLHALVQGQGKALRMESVHFRNALGNSSALQRELKRYIYVIMGQLAQTAACTRFHVVEARLARWLLMTQDRAHSDHLHITHEFLARMLGVRRVGITKSATALQNRKLISYSRGEIKILDRTGLERASCGCYAADRSAYLRVMG